jgi:RHS repeat-associated protein
MQFDAQGRLDQLRFAEWQQQLSFAWDERGRPLGVGWNGRTMVQLGSDDAAHCSWVEAQDGLRLQTWHERGSGRALRQRLGRGETPCWQIELERDAAFRLSREGERRYGYDALGRLVEACDGEQRWAWRYDLADLPLDALPVDALGQPHGAATPQVWSDAAGRIERVLRQAGGRDDDHSPGAELAAGEFVYRHNQAGELLELLRNGRVIARCDYDHKGRLLRLQTEGGTERYVYGSDDGLLAVADAAGQPRLILLRTPLGLVGAIDFRRRPEGEFIHLWCDHAGNLVAASRPGEAVTTLHRYDPWGLPLAPSPIGCDGGADIDLPRVDLPPINLPPIYRGRLWQAALGLYRLGGRWYDPRLRRFLTPDTHTGAPDDARLVNPFVPAGAQRMRRASVLGTWLREPRLRQRWAYCSNDPVNRFDPNGHWSAGGVLLSLLGVLWTLPNTAFGLAIEVSCLLGEVVRWLVHACSGGEVSWQTPGFDVAASGRLNAFALVFKGGWIGSFEHLLGITFGNVIFVNGNYQQHEAILALPDEVAPTAYGGSVTIPRAQALYEHELRHVNQYSWWGPFFHLGLPLFGIYEWDVILNGYQDASLEQDARAHGGL